MKRTFILHVCREHADLNRMYADCDCGLTPHCNVFGCRRPATHTEKIIDAKEKK